jgi:hypothetical protein
MATVGGRITVAKGGVRFSPRGKATIKPAMIANSVIANHDGTISTTRAAKPATADLTFDRGSAAAGTQRPKWDSVFMLDDGDWTIAEVDVGVLHIFTAATIVGEPSIDTETGEVSGLSIATGNYTQTKL